MGLPLAAYAPYGTLELAQNALIALQNGNLIAMEKHGILSIGKNLEEALSKLMHHPNAIKTVARKNATTVDIMNRTNSNGF